MFWTIPTLMTWTRIVAIPLIVGVFYAPLERATRNLIATVMFIVFAATDWLDGYLARKLNQSSAFGAFLDPVADKFLVCASLLVLVHLHRVDALTGLAGRRHWQQQADATLRRLREQGAPAALLMLDIDRFKDINDQYGHAAGDAAIADLASILRFEMRRNDQVFRFGGEEFVALLELDGTEDLEAATERLRKVVRSSLRGPGGRITISLGAAMLREQEKTWHDWFSRADAALYRAKSAGRDSYVIADDLL